MRSRATPRLALAAILTLAFGLRLWGIGFGLPYAYHADEPTYVSAALNLGAGIIGRQPNPTGFSNVLFGEYVGYLAVGRIAGLFGSVADFERAYRLDPSVFLLLGRLTSALAGGLTTLVVYRLGKELEGRAAGLFAGLFVAAAFLHVRDSHYGVPDVTVTFFISLTVLLCVLAVRQPGRWYRNLAAASGGFAIAVKWSAWPVLVPLLLMLFLSRPAVGDQPTRVLLRQALIALLFFVGGMLLGGFQLFIKPAVYLEYATRELRAGQGGGFGFWQIDVVPGWQFYLQTLDYGLGIVLLVLAIAGCARRIALSIRNRDRDSFIVLSFPLAYYLAMGASRHYFARYALPLVPFAALFAAEAIAALLPRSGTRHVKLASSVVVLLVVAAVVQPLADDVAHDMLLTRLDTRTLAKNWIEATIPAGATVALDWPTHGPPLSTPERVMPDSSRNYQVTTVGGVGLSDHPLEWYIDQEYEYLVASSFIYDIPLIYQRRDAERQAFYDSLDQKLELVQEFRPGGGDIPFIFDEIYGPSISLWERERPGPTLKIYRVQRRHSQASTFEPVAGSEGNR